jgi:hypothetical protein
LLSFWDGQAQCSLEKRWINGRLPVKVPAFDLIWNAIMGLFPLASRLRIRTRSLPSGSTLPE